jgi:Putative DNA-binding domain
LLECLREEFPATARAVGDEAFDGLAFGYLQEHPSESYTLSDLAARFPHFLAESRPPNENADGSPNWADFLIDLARLERTYSEVFDGPGVEDLPERDLDDLLRIPTREWGNVRFVAAPCLRLESFRFAVQEFASAVRNKQDELPSAEPHPTWLAISRLHYRVRRWSLSEPQYRLLQRLTEGDSLLSALEAVFRDSDEEERTLSRSLREWFAEWSSARLFIAVFTEGTPLRYARSLLLIDPSKEGRHVRTDRTRR